MADSNLQYFENFKYASNYNFIKVKLMKLKNDVKVGHCYIDLRGYQKGKFIHMLRTMNAKSYTSNAQSSFPLTQLKLSLFLETHKIKAEDQIQQISQDQELLKMNFLYSFMKTERSFVNIYRPQHEYYFQKNMIEAVDSNIEYDY
jgi:hypothetical protein